MEVKSLYTIAPPDKNRSPSQVAEELVTLIRREYRFNTANLCDILHCERQWVEKYIRDNVRHIRITHYFGRYILSHVSLSEHEINLIAHGLYFYSEPDLQRYWRENAYAERKTKIIDLADYQYSGFPSDLRHELDYHQQQRSCAKEKQRHLERMQGLLTARGYDLYLSSLTVSKEWSPVELPELTSSLSFTNLVTYKEANGLHSISVSMQHLIRRGGIRIKLGAKALWLLPDLSNIRIPVAVPADLPLKKE